MKTILVPTDFSPVSVNAAGYAADMAMDIHAELLLVHVYQLPLAYTAEAPLMAASVDDLRKESDTGLDDLKEKLLTHGSRKIKIQTRSVMGDTIDELEKLCGEIHPFAVILGAKGKTGMEKIVFGSTALSAVRHLSSPVIAVPPGKGYGKGIVKIGFACDFKQVAETIPAQVIRDIVWEFDAELHILNVDYNEKHFTMGTPAESFILHELFKELHPEYHYLSNPDVEDGIGEFAEAGKLDLIIAIPKKHKLLEGIFKASSTKQLLFQSTVPVMCIHE